MSDQLVQVLPNGHLVMPPEFRRLVRRVKAFTVAEHNGSLLLTPVTPPAAEMQDELLSPALEQQAAQRREELSQWLTVRHPREESKARVLNLFGLVSEEDISSDASENFRSNLYSTQQ